MTFPTNKQKFPSEKSPFLRYSVQNLYAVHVLLRRNDFVVKVKWTSGSQT